MTESTSGHLYRFRSTYALLDGFQELESQQIYFSLPDQLNDPLEGFKDIFWMGDRIVWRNLFRHYILNLLQATSIFAITGAKLTTDLSASLIHQTDDDLPKAPIRDVYANACRMFFESPAVLQLIDAFSASGKAVRRDELIFYLLMIHPLALHVVLTALGRRGQALMKSTAPLEAMLEGLSQKLEEALRGLVLADELSDHLYRATSSISSQLDLIFEFNNAVTEEQRSWLSIARDFPDYYVAALVRLRWATC